MTEEELDRRLAALPGFEPPVAAQRHVLREVGVPAPRIAELLGTPALVAVSTPVSAGSGAEEGASSSWGGGAEPPRNAPPSAPRPDATRRPLRRFAPAVAIVTAFAAGLLLAVPAPPERADPAQLVPRGEGTVAPTIGLRVAVDRGGAVERLAAGRSYRAGDTLIFRISAPAAMEVTLRRNEAVLFRGAVPAGDSDLPVGYALEAGEGTARFVVEGGGAVDVVTVAEVAP